MVANENIDGPTQRALVIAEAIKQASLVPGPSTLSGLLAGVVEALGMPEEQVGGDLCVALSVLIRCRLLTSNTVTRDHVLFSAETILAPSKLLTSFLWDDGFVASVS